MRIFISLSIFLLAFTFQSFGIGPINGTLGTCVGDSSLVSVDPGLISGIPSGTWSSSNPAVAIISSTGYLLAGLDTSSAAYVTGVSAGTATITYTDTSGVYVTAVFTVMAAPAAITGGPTSFCVGATATFFDATPSGVWSSTGGVSISAAGVATGLWGGVTDIYYTVGLGCHASQTITINATTVASIDSATIGLCVGSTATITDATPGGTWSSSNPTVATIGPSTGLVTGMSAGFVTMTYTVMGACGAAFATTDLSIFSGPSPGTISGPSVVYIGGSPITLSDVTVGSGIWSSSNPAIAAIGSATGIVTGISAGTVTISYAVSLCSSTAYATKIVTVSPFDGISGHVIFPSSYFGSVKVWLIHYDPTAMTLSALDSVVLPCSGSTSANYEFMGIATDSFRIKAAISDSAFTPAGYIPTYHNSFYYWHDADVINHTSATSDVNQNITMLTGTPTGGPGFISGSVLTGANRGTSLGTPVVGLHMVCLTSSGSIAKLALTDASGNYSFTGLPFGTYTVFPDSLNYFTTPFTGITLSSSTPGFSTAGFQQHNLLKTITPGTLGINTPVSVATVSTYPNPTTGKLNIVWNEKADERATITIADITGREVYQSTIIMTEGTGMTVVNLSAMTNGVYIVSVKSASLNYTSKVEIQH